MKRTKLHTLEPESALQRIDAAKSNKPFMTALLDRGHPGHKDALAHWSRLHDVAFEESAGRAAEPRRAGTRQASTRGIERGSARRPAYIEHRSESRRAEAPAGRAKARGSAEARGSRQAVYPDPERPLDVDRSVISPFLRRQDESEQDWLRRVTIAANGPRVSIERLAIIREAILREIGFYDLGSESATDDGAMPESEWRVLAALQNVPVDGWESALSIEDEARAEFEQRGILGFLEVLGPDGNIYHRLSILGENPVGDALTTVDHRIRMLRLADPDLDVLSVLPAFALTRPGREGGTPARSPLATTVAPRIQQFIRSRRGLAAAGLATGIGVGLVGDAAMDRRAGSEMEAAPDLLAAPGFEPERPEERMESFPEHRPAPEPSPGFRPEGRLEPLPGFPDQRGELPNTDIMDAQTLPDGTQPMPAKTRGGQDWEPSFNSWMANAGQRLLDRRDEKPTEPIARSESFIWSSLLSYKPGIRTNGLSGKRRRYFEWDFGGDGTHQSEIEVYDQHAAHIGAMDPLTGIMKEGSRVEGRKTDISSIDNDDDSAFV